MQDLLAGRVNLSILQPTVAMPQVRSGKIRAYAVTAKTRMRTAPDIPTVDEAGVPGVYVSVWSALWAPKGTPNTIIAQLNAAVVSALGDPGVRQRLTEIGQEFLRASSNPRKHWPRSKQPRSQNGGRLSRPPTSRRSR